MKTLEKRSFFARANDAMVSVETFLLALITIALVVVIFIEVICRYWLYISTAWTEELARYLFIWMTYIGSAYAVNEGTHVEIDVFEQTIKSLKIFKKKELWIKCLNALSLIVTGVFLVVFCNIFWDYMMRFWQSSQTSPTMHIPMGLIYLPVFIGNVMTFLHCFNRLVELLKRPASGETEEVK